MWIGFWLHVHYCKVINYVNYYCRNITKVIQWHSCQTYYTFFTFAVISQLSVQFFHYTGKVLSKSRLKYYIVCLGVRYYLLLWSLPQSVVRVDIQIKMGLSCLSKTDNFKHSDASYSSAGVHGEEVSYIIICRSR